MVKLPPLTQRLSDFRALETTPHLPVARVVRNWTQSLVHRLPLADCYCGSRVRDKGPRSQLDLFGVPDVIPI